jgi:hypothetical protein
MLLMSPPSSLKVEGVSVVRAMPTISIAWSYVVISAITNIRAIRLKNRTCNFYSLVLWLFELLANNLTLSYLTFLREVSVLLIFNANFYINE